MNQNKTRSKDTKNQETLHYAHLRRPTRARVEGMDGARAHEALVGTEGLHVTILQDRSPRGR